MPGDVFDPSNRTRFWPEPDPFLQGGVSMKRSLIVLVALVTLSVPVVCAAAPPHPGPYAAGFLGVSAANDTDVSSTDFFTGRSFNDRVEFDPGIFVGGAFSALRSSGSSTMPT